MGRIETSTITVPFNDLRRGLLSDRELILEAVTRVVDSGWTILGTEVASFEAEFADWLGVAGAVGVANGTDAIEIALRSVGVEAGDEVITVANAGGYSSVAILAIGAIPVFVDVEPETLCIDPQAALDAVTDRTKAVVVTHLYGQAAQTNLIVQSLRSRSIPVVEDCAQAHGTMLDGHLVGSTGAVAAFSMYPTKNLAALGDAGLVASSDPATLKRSRQLRTYGWEEKYHVTIPGGRNSRLDEVQAAILRSRSSSLAARNARRRAIAAHYRSVAASLDWVGTMNDNHSAHLCVFRHEHRAKVMASLLDDGVRSDVHYPVPDHAQQALAGLGPTPHLPITEDACRQVLSVPNFPELADSEVEIVAAALARL